MRGGSRGVGGLVDGCGVYDFMAYDDASFATSFASVSLLS